MSIVLHAVIMAGGSGTRFWPASRQARPKQFLSLFGERSLIQAAWDRCQAFVPASQCYVVAGRGHAEVVQEQLPELPIQNLLLEPCPRNTAACIGLAAARLLKFDPEAIMVALPSDHLISTTDQFAQAVNAACGTILSRPESLVLFGIRPSHPATGYGYIEVETAASAAPTDPTPGMDLPVVRFREKPDRATAEAFLSSGRFLWNSGIFVWKAARLWELLGRREPDLAKGLASIAAAQDWSAAVESEFPRLPSISIDNAVLEREGRSCRVIAAPFQWDDVGNWEAVARWSDSDVNGNVGRGLRVLESTTNCIVQTSSQHLVVTSGIEGLLIVHTENATLIARRDDEAAMRRLVEHLKSHGLSDRL